MSILQEISGLGDIRHNFADLEKIQKDLNFVPAFQFSDGIKYFTDWVNTQDTFEDLYASSIQELKERGLYK